MMKYILQGVVFYFFVAITFLQCTSEKKDVPAYEYDFSFYEREDLRAGFKSWQFNGKYPPPLRDSFMLSDINHVLKTIHIDTVTYVAKLRPKDKIKLAGDQNIYDYEDYPLGHLQIYKAEPGENGLEYRAIKKVFIHYNEKTIQEKSQKG